MKKLILPLFLLMSSFAFAQEKEEEEKEKEKEKTPFRETLFTGGSISLAFYNNTFLAGVSPVLGTSLTNFIDVGIVVNYNYTSYRDVQAFDDRLRQTVYGGGVFTKIYPIRFLFAQAQVEHNFIKQKYIQANGSSSITRSEGNSVLVGGGYTTGRYGRGGQPFYYLAVLFDISDDPHSPYTDAYGRAIPIIRAGLQIPLFQREGSKRDD